MNDNNTPNLDHRARKRWMKAYEKDVAREINDMLERQKKAPDVNTEKIIGYFIRQTRLRREVVRLQHACARKKEQLVLMEEQSFAMRARIEALEEENRKLRAKADRKPADDPLMNSVDAAKYLGFPTIRSLAYARRAGDGPEGLKINGRAYYYKSDLDAWLAKHPKKIDDVR